MPATLSPREHLLLPWTVQEREDPLLEFDRAEGVYFYDRQGRRYLDFLAQIFNCNLGHGNRRVIEAIQRQAERYCCVSPQLVSDEKKAIARALAERTPGDLNKCFFVNSGSEADDQAFILARLVTGRPKIFSKYRSYHGTTTAGLGVGGDPRHHPILRSVLLSLRLWLDLSRVRDSLPRGAGTTAPARKPGDGRRYCR